MTCRRRMILWAKVLLVPLLIAAVVYYYFTGPRPAWFADEFYVVCLPHKGEPFLHDINPRKKSDSPSSGRRLDGRQCDDIKPRKKSDSPSLYSFYIDMSKAGSYSEITSRQMDRSVTIDILKDDPVSKRQTVSIRIDDGLAPVSRRFVYRVEGKQIAPVTHSFNDLWEFILTIVIWLAAFVIMLIMGVRAEMISARQRRDFPDKQVPFT